jgi:hypothetical protein
MAPTDGLYAEIRTDDGTGKPSATVVTNGTSATVAASAIATSYGWIAFDFPTAPQLTGATQYHIVLKRSGALDDTNYYAWGLDMTSASYADGTASSYITGVWVAHATYDFAFEVYNEPPYAMTKLWVINTSLSPALKLAVIKTFAAADVIVIDSSLFEATINAVAAANTEGAYPSLDPRTTNNALELHVLATSPPTLSVTTAFTARYLS